LLACWLAGLLACWLAGLHGLLVHRVRRADIGFMARMPMLFCCGGGGEACACRMSLRGVFDCGLGLRGPSYVRAKDLKCATPTLKNWRFETRFFASFLFAFEKK
jgi:hypothetical protein